jgi:phosphoribosylformylglycinamidine synthase
MNSAVIVFPGTNCERDIAVTLNKTLGHKTHMVWHQENTLPNNLDFVVIPGGFSYGDYLRSGAMAANSPIIQDLKSKAKGGLPTIGICNGFQILIECGLLDGALLRNRGLRYICRDVHLRVEENKSLFTNCYDKEQIIKVPIGHHDGNYFADGYTLEKLESEQRVAFRYCDKSGIVSDKSNPNGSVNNVAGIFNSQKTILGMMPHPERLADPRLGGEDGTPLFHSLLEALS